MGVDTNKRVSLLKAMHEIVLAINDENAYFDWILLVPDQPSDDDFEDIASSDVDMSDAMRLFVRLIHKYCPEDTQVATAFGCYL